MTDSLVGFQLDEYRLEALLGRGNMARVYLAMDTRLKRRTAIKIIDMQFQDDPDYVKRFQREAQAIAQLDHPHIVKIYRYGDYQGTPYMAMQYVEGADLAAMLAVYRKNGKIIDAAEAVQIVREIGLALDYAHAKRIIHRDIKPHNIMLDKQGNVILADFGLVLLTDVGTRGEIFGSPHYIAPEQAVSSANVVPQSDLYAVGVILYEMFTGQLPFTSTSPMEVAMMHITQPPRPPRELRPEISQELEDVILKAMAKRPDQRYPTGAALTEALARALHIGGVPKPVRMKAIRAAASQGDKGTPARGRAGETYAGSGTIVLGSKTGGRKAANGDSTPGPTRKTGARAVPVPPKVESPDLTRKGRAQAVPDDDQAVSRTVSTTSKGESSLPTGKEKTSASPETPAAQGVSTSGDAKPPRARRGGGC